MESDQDKNAQDFRSEESAPMDYLFLNEDVWDGEETPVDLAEKHDRYLYDDGR